MRRRGVCIVLSVLLVFFACTALHAEMTRISFDAYTETWRNAGGTQLYMVTFGVEVFDTEKSHSPDYVQSVIITAPNGTTFDITKNWLQVMRMFFGKFQTSAFPGGVIPSGTYTVAVKDISGRVLKAFDGLTVAYLPMPVLSQPTQGALITSDSLQIKWSAVSGARVYRITLLDLTDNWAIFPNYRDPERNASTSQTYFDVPKAVLQPNHTYGVQISAALDWQDVDRVSFGNYVTFTTGGW
jgi:hypothetical protein